MSLVVLRFPKVSYAKYDWAEWFDGRVHKCAAGVDFKSSPHVFIKAAHMRAKKRRVKLKTMTHGSYVYLQAIQK